MKVSRHILANSIAERTIDIVDAKLLAKEIAAYLLTEGRVNELGSILRDVMQYRADHGLLEAEVVSAHELDAAVLSDIKSLLSSIYPAAQKVQLNQRLDADVIGGVRIDMANEQLDMTVEAKLATFKRLTSARGNA